MLKHPSDLHIAVHDAIMECYRQDEEWGLNRIQSALKWNAILTEETGEVAKEVNEEDRVKMRAELVQVAAVALNWIKALDRGEVT